MKAALAGIATIAADMQAFLGAEAMAWEDMLQLGAFCRVIAAHRGGGTARYPRCRPPIG